MKLNNVIFNRNSLLGCILSLVLFAGLGSLAGKTNAISSTFGDRQVRVVSAEAQAGTQVTVPIEIDSQGNEVAISFSLAFDPAVLSNPVVTIGPGGPAGANVGSNMDLVGSGRLGVLWDATSPLSASPPNRVFVNVRFDIAANAPAGATPIIFVSAPPTSISIASLMGALLPATYQPGSVTVLPPTVSLVTIGGRVTTPSGQNLRNTVVTLIDSNNVRRTATTSSFGLYSFSDVSTGQTYTLTVASKRYRFSPRVESITASASNIDFVGLE